MRYNLVLSLCASVLVIAGCGSEEANTSAGAADPRKEFNQAADALLAKVESPGAKAEMPAVSDPAVQAFEVQAAKAMTALGTDNLPVEGFESFEELCGKTARIAEAYVAAGTSGTSGAAQQQKMEANVEAYMDQMFTPLLFSAHCTAAHMPFVDGAVKGNLNPAMSAAAQQVRGGALQQVVGMMQIAADPSLDADRRRRVVELLASDAANFATGLDPDQRRQAIEAAQQLRASLPAELQAKADKFRADVEAAKCGNLCSLT